MASRLDRALRGRPGAVHCPEYGRRTAQSLTPRELEVLAHLSRGLTNKEAASRLGISVRTVEAHRANLKRKSGEGTVAGLVRLAVRLGLETV